MTAVCAAVRESKPSLYRVKAGGWLAVSGESDRLSIGIKGDSPEDALQSWKETRDRLVDLINAPE